MTNNKKNRRSILCNDMNSADCLSPKTVLSVVLPAYNEAKTIESIVNDYFDEIICKIPSKLIIAEDGSVDGTREILLSMKDDLPICLLSDHNRKGYAKGVRDALIACDDEWVFFSDSDGQYLSSDFWKLWSIRENYDMVIGRKVNRKEGTHRIILAKGFHGIANSLFSLDMHDCDCGFRLIRKELIESIIKDVRFLKYSFWAEFTIRAYLKGFRIFETPINHASRTVGGSQIYKPSKIPIIVIKQLKGLVDLYKDTRRYN
jgi:glycosyltransferase involved in cell wall biosynthesis